MSRFNEDIQEQVKSKLVSIIQRGETELAAGLDSINREWSARKDMIVRPGALKLDVAANGTITPRINGDTYQLTDHSRGQLLARANIPGNYFDKMVNTGATRLARANLVQMLRRTSADGLMLREVNGTVKGVMSSSYKRVDTAPIFEHFYTQAVDNGMVPLRAVLTDTRAGITMIGRNYREIAPGEHVVFGMQISNSDYGAGAVLVNLLVLRVICVNLATGIDIFRRVHLGRRFQAESDYVQLSQETQDLDAAAIASAVKDAVASGHRYLKHVYSHLKDTAEKPVNLAAALENLKKGGFSKEDLAAVESTYNNQALPVEVLPPVQSRWRLSNVLSHLAQSKEGDKKLEFERAGFQILFPERELVPVMRAAAAA